MHVPKAAGISVATTLYGNMAGSHTPLSRDELVFSRRDFERYFKFTFVRNPWDRLYSAYTFLKNGGRNQSDEAWTRSNLGGFSDFESFVLK